MRFPYRPIPRFFQGFPAVAAVTSVLGFGLAADAQGLRGAFSTILTEAARDLTEDQSFPLCGTDPKYKGTLRAVEPEERLVVLVDRFRFEDDTAHIEFRLKGRVCVDGHFISGDRTSPLGGVVDFEVGGGGWSRMIHEEDRFFVRSHIEEISVEFEALSIIPDDAQGGPEFLTDILNKTLKARRDQILAKLNEQIAEKPLPQP